MEIIGRLQDGVLVADLKGPLTAGGEEKLRQAINEYVAYGHQKVLLNLSDVSRIDSTGVGELVASIKLVERFGGAVKLVRIHPRVRHILDLSRILPVLDFYDTTSEALDSFLDVASDDTN